jgi:hypothetical protein
MPDPGQQNGRQRQQQDGDEDRDAPEAIDPAHELDEMGGDVRARDDAHADDPGPGQVRRNAPHEHPARDDEQPRPDEDDRDDRDGPGQHEPARQAQDQGDDRRRGQRIEARAVVGGGLH